MKQKIEGILNRILETHCWNVGAGGSAGSFFMLDFGEKIPRIKPLVQLAGKIRDSEGQFRIFVQDVHWELYENKKMIAYDESDSKISGTLVTSLKKLEGKKLMHYILDSHFNLILYFNEFLMLRIFSLRKSLNFDSLVPLYTIVDSQAEEVSVN